MLEKGVEEASFLKKVKEEAEDEDKDAGHDS
jgi:hypothetical protein